MPKVFFNVIGTSEYTAIMKLCKEYNIDNKNERVFFTTQLQVASKVYYLNNETEIYSKEIKRIAIEIIGNFQTLSGISFTEYEELSKAF